MIKIDDNDKKSIIEDIISNVNNNYPYVSTDIGFFCCEVVRRYMCKMKYEGPYSIFNNISFLYSTFDFSQIKTSPQEQILLIAYNKEDINDKHSLIVTGAESYITAEDYFKSHAVDKIIEWHNKGYQILHIHNHPLSIAALPSLEDINTFMNFKNDEWKECEKKYNISLPSDFDFCDFLIVTKFDLFSFNKNKENLPNLIKYLETYKDELYLTPEFSEEELFEYDIFYETGLTADNLLYWLKHCGRD